MFFNEMLLSLKAILFVVVILHVKFKCTDQKIKNKLKNKK